MWPKFARQVDPRMRRRRTSRRRKGPPRSHSRFAIVDQRLDIFVANAGISNAAAIEEQTIEDFDNLFATNVRSPFFLVKGLLPLFREGSNIIVVSSLGARAAPGNPGQPGARHSQPTQPRKDAGNVSEALGCNARAARIRVNAVAPGVIETDMSHFTKTEAGRGFTLAMQALKRIGQPSDVADVIAFLASDGPLDHRHKHSGRRWVKALGDDLLYRRRPLSKSGRRPRWARPVEPVRVGAGRRVDRRNALGRQGEARRSGGRHRRGPLAEERVTAHLNGQGLRYSFAPDRVAVEDEDGRVVSERAEPRAAFRGHTAETAWDELHVAYFSGYALWTYLTIPFLYTYPGFVTEELPPWSETGKLGGFLKATFPADVASHAREQVSYFGPDGLLRRHEYTVEVLGGSTGLNYAADYQTVGGIVVPVTRRVYAADAEHRKIPDPLLVSIDLRDISFNRN